MCACFPRREEEEEDEDEEEDFQGLRSWPQGLCKNPWPTSIREGLSAKRLYR